MSKTVRIGCAAGFYGDSQLSARQLVDKGEIDYLVFDYLAEITMAILGKARSKNDDLGFAIDFVTVAMKDVLADCAAKGIKVVANAGGVNVPACIAALEMALAFKPYDLHWLEEPIFPPEDFASLAGLQRETGIPLAAGENACTSFDFQKMFAAGAVSYAQPSVTKVGGITEFLKVAALARSHGVEVMPHSPYFGPGFLASLQLAAALPDGALIERFFLDLDATLYGDLIDAVDGDFRLPVGPGLGMDPDPDVIERYRVRDA